MSFVLSLTQMLVLLSLYVMLSILLSILVCAAASLFCACLVSVQVSAPYVIAGSTQEYNNMARQSGVAIVNLQFLITCLVILMYHNVSQNPPGLQWICVFYERNSDSKTNLEL